MPHEIHPDTPPGGRDMTELFNRFDIDQVLETCNQRGRPYGIRFGELARLSNSNLALQAAEFARDNGVFDPFHTRLFTAYFTDGKDIGDRRVILVEADGCGLDVTELAAALEERRYAGRVAEGSVRARAAMVTAIPTFVIEGVPTITGAVNETVFRRALEAAARVGSRGETANDTN